jgi:hypothetical protein
MTTQDDSHTGNGASNDRNYNGDGPGKIGLRSDKTPNLVAPSGVNERDHGAQDQVPAANDMDNLDGDEMLSDRNGPSDPADGTKRSS